MRFLLFSSLTFSSFLRATNERVQYCKIVPVVNPNSKPNSSESGL